MGPNLGKVSQYMSYEAETVDTSCDVGHVKTKISENGHDGYPVCKGDNCSLIGYIKAKDVLCVSDDKKVGDIMDKDISTVTPDMKIKDAARVMFRQGLGELPVTDNKDDKNIVGLISNADIVRSQIERVTPSKIESTKNMIQQIHNVDTDVIDKTQPVDVLKPTQMKVFKDELVGRKHELQKGLAEPIVVVKNGGELVLVDGHHRALAAKKLDMNGIETKTIVLSEEVNLGLTNNRQKRKLNSLSDIDINEKEKHPLIQKTDLE